MKHATLRAGTYDDVHAEVEQLARNLDPYDYLTRSWLRELAITLARQGDLVVSIITYNPGGQELEVRLVSAPSDGLVIGRGATGGQAQISDRSVGRHQGRTER